VLAESKTRQLSHDGAGNVSRSGIGGIGKKRRTEADVRAESKEASDSPAYNHRDIGISAMDLLHGATSIIPTGSAAAAGMVSKEKTNHSPSVTEEVGVTFPERLMELLMNETDEQALWWLPDGMTFAIHSKKFTKTILAKNFQGSKFESFTRKLARW
jgi:HSF-type DNA-binding